MYLWVLFWFDCKEKKPERHNLTYNTADQCNSTVGLIYQKKTKTQRLRWLWFFRWISQAAEVDVHLVLLSGSALGVPCNATWGSGFDVRVAGVGLTAAGGSAEVPRDAAICRTDTQTTMHWNVFFPFYCGPLNQSVSSYHMEDYTPECGN